MSLLVLPSVLLAELPSDVDANSMVAITAHTSTTNEKCYLLSVQELLAELPTGVDADSMVATTSQLIDDMEEQQVIADRCV